MARIFGFCACRSHTGKTTLILKVLREMQRCGVVAAVLKHGLHGGTDAAKDGSRYAAEGAGSLFVSPEGWVLESHRERELSLDEAVGLLQTVTGCELILVEGYKKARIPKIAVCRRDVCLALPCPPEELSAVVCDIPLPVALPQFRFEDIHAICDFVLSHNEQE